MQLKWLQVFCEVARSGSFSQAALAHGLTQPAASQIVAQLEKRLEVQLFDRSTRPLQLTSLGRTYFEGCKRLIEDYLQLEESIRQAQARLAASVQVAAIYSVGLGDMGQLVERLADRQPSARVHIDYLHPDRVYERVRDGTADLGLVSFPRKSPELTALPWREEAMVLVCPPAHRLAGLKAVAVAELAGEKYVGFDKHLVIRREVDRFLRKHAAAVEVALEFDNIETIKKAIEDSAGVALLPEPTVRKEVRAGTLVAVPLAGARLLRPLGIIHRRAHKLSLPALRFIDLLRHPEGADVPESPADFRSLEDFGSLRGTENHNGSHSGSNGAPRGPKRTS